jgi:hypothetical protein
MTITLNKIVFEMLNKDLPKPTTAQVFGFILYHLGYRHPKNEAYIVEVSHNFDIDTETNPLFGYDRKDYYFEYDYMVVNGKVIYGKLFTFKKLWKYLERLF